MSKNNKVVYDKHEMFEECKKTKDKKTIRKFLKLLNPINWIKKLIDKFITVDKNKVKKDKANRKKSNKKKSNKKKSNKKKSNKKNNTVINDNLDIE